MTSTLGELTVRGNGKSAAWLSDCNKSSASPGFPGGGEETGKASLWREAGTRRPRGYRELRVHCCCCSPWQWLTWTLPPSALTQHVPWQVSYRAQQGDTRQAVQKMVLVWVLAFLLYGPAILSWEYLSGGSSIPEGHCYAEFFYNWYFLITASTLEFFTPFLSVTFFNLSIYLNIQRRTRDRLDGAREAASLEAPPGAQGSPLAAPGCWSCWQKRRGEAVPLHRYGVGDAAPGAEAGDAALGGSGGGTAASPTSSSGSSSRGTERPRSLKRGSKPSASSASLEKRMKMVSQSVTQRFRLSRDKKVAKSLAVIVSIFGLCWAPYTLLMIIRAACHGHCVPDYWYETSFWLLWANSAINPILYPLCHYSFRRAFTKLLCPHKLKVQPHSSLEHCWK